MGDSFIRYIFGLEILPVLLPSAPELQIDKEVDCFFSLPVSICLNWKKVFPSCQVMMFNKSYIRQGVGKPVIHVHLADSASPIRRRRTPLRKSARRRIMNQAYKTSYVFESIRGNILK